jgi:hypothetical protein
VLAAALYRMLWTEDAVNRRPHIRVQINRLTTFPTLKTLGIARL